VCERAPAAARTRGFTPRKAAAAYRLSRQSPTLDIRCDYWLAAIGEDGGYLTWASSPHVMWLAARLAAQA
jgi:hypothetical protein